MIVATAMSLFIRWIRECCQTINLYSFPLVLTLKNQGSRPITGRDPFCFLSYKLLLNENFLRLIALDADEDTVLGVIDACALEIKEINGAVFRIDAVNATVIAHSGKPEVLQLPCHCGSVGIDIVEAYFNLGAVILTEVKFVYHEFCPVALLGELQDKLVITRGYHSPPASRTLRTNFSS